MTDKSKTNEKIPNEKTEERGDSVSGRETTGEIRKESGGSKRGFRRALAMIALVAGVAVALSYWSRMEKVDVTLVVNAAHAGARINKAEIFLLDSQGSEQVRISLSEIRDLNEPLRRTLSLQKGDYVLKTVVHKIDGTEKRTERRIEVKEDLSLTLNLR